MNPSLDKKYKIILSSERLMAKAVAIRVIQSKPLTVWEVTIPPILIFNLLRLKSAREIFTQNFLFTKQLAMDGSLEMVQKNQNRESALSKIKDKTDEVLISDTQGIYSHGIRQMQLEEIDLLLIHYYKLLQAEGDDYASLVSHVYGTKRRYVQFLEQLREKEADVELAAMETLRTDNPPEIIAKMESATNRVRMAKADEIFEPHA